MVKVLTGNNQLAIQQKLHEIIDGFEKEHAGSIERFDGAEIDSADSILDAVRSISFLDPKKLVIVRDPSASKKIIDKLEDIISQTADSTELVIVGNFDKRSSLYKNLVKKVDVKEFNELSPIELNKWIANYVKEQKGSINHQASNYLIEQIGPDQYRLKNELDKLLLSGKTIDKLLIDEMVEPVPQSKVFSLLDAMFQGDATRAWWLYKEQRMQGEEPYKIIAMITWQLQQLTYAVFAPNKTKEELVKAGVSPYTAQKSLQLARNINPTNLKYFISQLTEIDYLSKTSAAVESALVVYITDVAKRQQA